MPDSRRRSWLDPDQGDDRPRHAASTRASAGSVFMGSSEGWRPKGFPVGTRSVHFWPRCARCGILGRGRRRLGHFGGVPPEEITPRCDWNWGPPRYTTSSSWRRLYVAVCIIGMLAKNRPVQLALAVITLAVQAIYILIEMNALGSW
jgi:hypothetical protein